MEQELAGFKSDLREQTDSTPSSSTATTIISETTQKLEPPLQNILYKLDTIYTQSKSIQQKIKKRLVSFYQQIFSKDFGKRGEEYILLQSLLGVSVLYGKFPLLQNVISTVFGPLLLSVGIFGLSSSVKRLYRNDLYSSFVIPPGVNSTHIETLQKMDMEQPQNVTIVTNGMYQHVRHPIYASTVAIMVGYSILTKSALRLLYTFVYYKLVEKKARAEEECLIKLGDYTSYQRQVKDAFVPLQWMIGVWNRVKHGRQKSVTSVIAKEIDVEMENHHKVPRVKKSGTVASKEPMEVKESAMEVQEIMKDSDKVETSPELKQENVVKAKEETKNVKEKDVPKKDTSSKNGIFSFKNNNKNSKGLFP
ncbi:hypothetical protein CTEN210_07256 [Chaetoceros tenuissimus]|uniref:Protein-S-isoprenylcysteine O-methyltransferase n=1 Tax=Chaetoceros tenuissimus TaxID=426638 RepID=A0AAD3H557_9STRA|nr:hypothetical protein CTEN210_07256 [Chaetoceros tenuissimus]